MVAVRQLSDRLRERVAAWLRPARASRLTAPPAELRECPPVWVASLSDPPPDAYNLTASTTDELSREVCAIWVGGTAAADVVVVTAAGQNVTYYGVPVGTLLVGRVRQLVSTTASPANALVGYPV